MLKAYDYAEVKSAGNEIQDKGLFNKEKSTALKYVLSHPSKNTSSKCPVCGTQHTRYIFSRWDVNYMFCEECSSIYVPVDEVTISEYLDLEDMKTLRVSKDYQEQAELRRGDIWDELVMWAEFRSYRYLGRNSGLDIIDYGNRYEGSIRRFRNSNMCNKYDLRDSIIDMETDKVKKADIILYMNQLQHEVNPTETLKVLKNELKEDGILILNTRLGSGFDILTLKGSMDSIFPYEHILLPSRRGLEKILEDAGYELLEVTTPGTRDMESVLRNKERIEDSNFFVKYLLDNADNATMRDFQQFLQKSGLSSFAQIVARVRK